MLPLRRLRPHLLRRRPPRLRWLRRPPAALIGQRIVIHASAQKIRQPFAADLFVAVRDQALSSIITATPSMATVVA